MDTWVVTIPDEAAGARAGQVRVVASFRDERQATERFYVEHIKEVLARNRFECFGSRFSLQRYGPSIIDAIHNHPIESRGGSDVSRADIAAFEFGEGEDHREWQRQMLRFYEDSDRYVAKVRAAHQ